MTYKFYTIKLSVLLAAVEAESESYEHSSHTCWIADDFCKLYFADHKVVGGGTWACLVREMFPNTDQLNASISHLAQIDAKGAECELYNYPIRKQLFARLRAQLEVSDRTLVIPIAPSGYYVPHELKPVYTTSGFYHYTF